MATKLNTFLWFNGVLDEALEFYRETFGDVEVRETNVGPNGKLFTATFSIFDYEFIAMNWPGGPEFNESISLSLSVDNQSEVDRIWSALTLDGTEGQCGWCKDKFGLSWQVTPAGMGEWLANPDAEIRDYANSQLRKMTKIILNDLHK